MISNFAINEDKSVTFIYGQTEHVLQPKMVNGEIEALSELDAETIIKRRIENPAPSQEQLAMDELRRIRNNLLKESDVVTMKAYSQGIAVPAEWAEYQQALRDITLQTPTFDTNGNLIGITWPVKPGE
jgi:hypothetical protein